MIVIQGEHFVFLYVLLINCFDRKEKENNTRSSVIIMSQLNFVPGLYFILCVFQKAISLNGDQDILITKSLKTKVGLLRIDFVW
jgi:hypothetical protein